MDFINKHAIVTGGANGIGRCISEYFATASVYVTVIDLDKKTGKELSESDYITFYEGDIADKETIDKFAASLKQPVDFLINNACIGRKGLLSNCSWEDFEYVQRVGVTAPYYLTKNLIEKGLLANGASIINIASTRAIQSQSDTESYSAAKGGILALTHAMSISLSGKARVNVISPGWIDTTYSQHNMEDRKQHPAGRVGKPEDIAEMVMFLCDNDRAGFITGENIIIDGGMSKLMIYHEDKGWKYNL